MASSAQISDANSDMPPPTLPAIKHIILIRLCLALGGAVLALIAIEFGLQTYHLYVRSASLYRGVSNPRLVFTRKPHVNRETNAMGFRDREHASSKTPGVTRILVLGDSVTQGFGVESDQVYTRRLEELLNQSTRRFEVINFGMSQYSTVQEIAALEELGLVLAPDLVVLAYVLNDPTPDGDINDFFARDRGPFLLWSLLRQRARDYRRRHSLNAQMPGCRVHDYYSRMHCDVPQWEASKDALSRLAELSRQHGFAVLVVIFPLLDPGVSTSFAPYRWHETHAQVHAAMEIHKFPTLDLLPTFSAHRPADLRVSETDALHFNALGHEIAAGALANAILALDTGAMD